MVPRLGLVCITDSDAVRFRTMTRKRFLELSESGPAAQERALHELYTDNLRRLDRAISFCLEQGIRLYRLTSRLFPFADESPGQSVLAEFDDGLAALGRLAADHGLRLVLHPDQFVVLNSDADQVISNSIRILETHARVFDLLRQPRSAWATFTIHGGKGNRAARLVEILEKLPDAVLSRLALENDERAYSAYEILEVCHESGVPMVFDAHHHIVHEGLVSYEHPSIAEVFAAARETWPDPAWQIVHISNGRERFNDPRHSDLIYAMPSAFRDAPWIEVEAKRKEVAIDALRARGWGQALGAG